MFANKKGQDLNLSGMYEGASVFLFGGGRSITKRHMELCKRPGIITASINEGGHYIRPDIYMSTSGITMPHSVLSDPSVMKFVSRRHWNKSLYEDRDRGKKIREYPNVVGMNLKVSSFSDFMSDEFVYQQEQRSGKYAKNSAITFINVLVKLGFRKIYLVGMDFYGDTNECTYFYEREYINKITPDLIGKVKLTLRQLLKLDDVLVFNTNKRSSLDFFRYISLEDAVKENEVQYKSDICSDFNTERVVWGWKEFLGIDKSYLLK